MFFLAGLPALLRPVFNHGERISSFYLDVFDMVWYATFFGIESNRIVLHHFIMDSPLYTITMCCFDVAFMFPHPCWDFIWPTPAFVSLFLPSPLLAVSFSSSSSVPHFFLSFFSPFPLFLLSLFPPPLHIHSEDLEDEFNLRANPFRFVRVYGAKIYIYILYLPRT